MVLVAARAVGELDLGFALAVTADRELVAEDDRGELAEVERAGVCAVDAAEAGLDVERGLDAVDGEDECPAAEADGVAAGQLAQDAAGTVEIGVLGVGNKVAVAAHSSRLVPTGMTR